MQGAAGSQEAQGNDRMAVDLENRKRKEGPEGEAEFQEAHQEVDDAETPVPTEKVPPPPLSMMDLMNLMQQNVAETKRGREENQANFQKLERDLATTQRDVQESKLLAAKATTLATDTNNSLKALEKRVQALEKGEPTPINTATSRQRGSHSKTRPTSFTSPAGEQRDWDFLGGEEGDTIVIGGFRENADKFERRTEWEKVEGLLPQPLRDQIGDTIIPSAPCKTVIIKIKKASTPEETRRTMLDWTKKMKAEKITQTTDGETEERSFYAFPSKPFEMRQRDSKVTKWADGLRLLLGDPHAEKIFTDMSRGRVFLGRTVLAERSGPTDSPSPRMEAINKIRPDTTREMIDEKVAEAAEKKERARKST